MDKIGGDQIISDYVVPTREMKQVKIAKDKSVETKLVVTKMVGRQNWW